MKRVLFFNEHDYWGGKMEDEGIKIFPLYKRIPAILKPLRILCFKYHFWPNIWYAKWREVVNQGEIVILPASYFSPMIAKYIINKVINNKVKLIYWYWDPVKPEFSPSKIPDRWEKWSFDKADCKRFSLKYNSTYYFDTIKLEKRQTKYDIIFIGQDKGRLSTLLQLNDAFEKMGLVSYLHIVRDRKAILHKKYSYNKRIKYNEAIELLSQSTAILDLIQDNQSGLTLRVMESLFFEKKLITNNQDILNYNLYKKENIFVLGKDRQEDIPEFLEIPYKKIDDEIIAQYEFSHWLNRIINNRILEDGIKENIS